MDHQDDIVETAEITVKQLWPSSLFDVAAVN